MPKLEYKNSTNTVFLFTQSKSTQTGCSNNQLVGKMGFEPTTSWSRTKRATKLRYFPILKIKKGQLISFI